MSNVAQPVEFTVQTPVTDEGLRENVRAALSLGLRGIEFSEFRSQLSIFANGPSSARFNGAAAPANSLAVNGALSLFDVAPRWWAGCDPQPELAEFLHDTPCGTVYLVASKCHPLVFETLRRQGCDVRIWHVWEPAVADLLEGLPSVSPGCSITSTVFGLAALMGYREFDVWGWDGCFGADGETHAGLNRGTASECVTIELPDGRQFASTHAWALELEDARFLLTGFPFPIRVHGGGLIGAALSELIPHRVTEIKD